MKQVRHFSHWVVAALLLCSVVDVSALTLGRIHGTAIVGRPLELTVAVEFAADEDATPDVRAICYGADVYFGDAQLASRSVQLQVTPGATAQTHTVRITTASRIDEPTVSVSLRAGCGRKTVRRYVLLSEMLSDLVPDTDTSALVAPASGVPGVAAATPVAALPGADADTAAQAMHKAKAASRKTSSGTKHKSGDKRARLKLSDSPLEVSAHAGKAARHADAQALEELQKRVDALAQWKETVPTADQANQLQARVKAFEGDLKGLHALTLKNQQSLQAVVIDIEHMQSSRRDGNLLLYAFAGVLALCVAAVVWVVLRVRNAHGDASPWWSGDAKAGKSTPNTRSQVGLARADPAPPSTVPQDKSLQSPVGAPGEPAVDIDIGAGAAAFVAMDAAGAASVGAAGGEIRRPDKRDFQASSSATLRSINTKEMLDVRQQAEFFMALGQHDEAVKVLEASITQSHDANPLVILDLLKIFHTLGRRSEFDHYRHEFNLQFTGRVPSYASFALEGLGLDTYEDICREIAALWPSTDALDYIEQCLVRTPDDGPDQGFDLDAFRDLLLLHGVLKRLDSAQESDLMPFSTTRNLGTTAELSDVLDSTMAERTLAPPLMALPEEVPSTANAVDLDLTESRNNLIDFDISGFTLDKPAGPTSK